MGSIDVVCVLHGDPALPGWLAEPSPRLAVHLVVNDPGPGRYSSLPTTADVHHNAEPLGFAANVNRALDRLGSWDSVVVTNFDVDADEDVLRSLIEQIDAGAALAAPALVDVHGRPVMSVGSVPTVLKEFLRAAGLRSGRLLEWQRALLRRRRSWFERNVSMGANRVLAAGEYLPWTVVALARAAWDDVGRLDERFFLYAEDVDWGIRCHAGGWQMVLVAAGRVHHRGRATESAISNAHYEVSHLRLHEKYGWDSLQRWQRRGLALRRWTPLRWLSPLEWSILTAATVGAEGSRS